MLPDSKSDNSLSTDGSIPAAFADSNPAEFTDLVAPNLVRRLTQRERLDRVGGFAHPSREVPIASIHHSISHALGQVIQLESDGGNSHGSYS